MSAATSHCILIYIYGTPIGQPRAKATVVAGHARMYTPRHPVSEFKAAIRQQAGPLFAAPLEGPVSISIVAVFPRPKSRIWKTRPMPAEPHTSKPDLDNIEKAVMDALTGIAYRDDSQVSRKISEKRMAAGDESPRTEVIVCPIELET